MSCLSLRRVLAAFLGLNLFISVPGAFGGSAALGVLTIAYQARVDEAAAFAGLSIFDGEELSTDAQGRVSMRVEHSVLSLGGNTSAVVYRIDDGVHVDLESGSVYFHGAMGEAAEMHVGEALLRTVGQPEAQAGVSLVGPKILQVTAQKGGVNFSYREEFRFLPEGQTYRIYLDAPGEPQTGSTTGAAKTGTGTKVAYFIVGAAVAGGLAAGIHAAVAGGGSAPISPYKP